MRKTIFAIVGLALILAMPAGAVAASKNIYEVDEIQRATGENGLTGLYYTASPYTAGTGLSANVHVVASSIAGTFTTVTPASITLGLGDSIEISGASRLYSSGGVTAIGDSEFNFKYSFRSHSEVMPAMALGLGVILPTSNNVAASDVTSLSGKIMMILGGEANVSDTTVVGMYINATAYLIDWGQASQDNYLGFNFGLMAPISDNQRMQGFFEARNIQGKTGPTLSGDNGYTLMLGLRYATRFLKITGGVEHFGTGGRVITGVALEI